MIELVLHYRKTSRFGLNALHGSVERDPRTRSLPVTVARGLEAAVAAALAVEAGLAPSVDLMFGLPGETEADREATRCLASRLAALGARVAAHAFMPLPGTPWAGEVPAAVDGTTRLLLDRLASAGRAHGPWRHQERRSP